MKWELGKMADKKFGENPSGGGQSPRIIVSKSFSRNMDRFFYFFFFFFNKCIYLEIHLVNIESIQNEKKFYFYQGIY